MLHVPILRAGVDYTSLETSELKGYADGKPLARISQANAGLVRRDLLNVERQADSLRDKSTREMLGICKEAGERFLEDTLPVNTSGDVQSPQDYVEALSATSGLPHNLCRGNMAKIGTVFRDMETILNGLTRGLDLDVIDAGVGEQDGVPVCFARAGRSLGVVLPSNSPGVNSIWIPALALKTPVILKPGREEPWTPMRIVRAFMAAGCPPEAFGFYPTSHEGAGVILERCDRSQLFGDAKTTSAWKNDRRVELHGPGFSKVLIGEDQIDDWESYLDVLVSSVVDNGGRSCINASSIFVPRHAEAIAAALAERIAAIEPAAPDDPAARLSAFASEPYANWIDATIDQGLTAGGATDVTATRRTGARKVERDGALFLRPTIIHCDSPDHALANTEYMFPFSSVVEVPQAEMLDRIGHSLVVTAITKDAAFASELVASPQIDRLNLGPTPTSRVDWDQPHEGNLFETLFTRRAIHQVASW